MGLVFKNGFRMEVIGSVALMSLYSGYLRCIFDVYMIIKVNMVPPPTTPSLTPSLSLPYSYGCHRIPTINNPTP